MEIFVFLLCFKAVRSNFFHRSTAIYQAPALLFVAHVLAHVVVSGIIMIKNRGVSVINQKKKKEKEKVNLNT
jgi:hypothetical protein